MCERENKVFRERYKKCFFSLILKTRKQLPFTKEKTPLNLFKFIQSQALKSYI